MTGTASAQAIALLCSPLLTRLYSPADFGLYALFLSGISLIGCLPTLRYELAIVQPEEDTDAANLLVLCLGLVTLCTIALWCLTLSFGPRLGSLLKVHDQLNWLWIIPVGAGTNASIQFFAYWFTRHKRFRWIAFNRMTLALLTVGFQIVGALLGKHGFEKLLIGYIIGQTAAVALFLVSAIYEDGSLLGRACRPAAIWKQAYSYRRYPIYSCAPTMVNNFTIALPVMFFTKFYGPTVTGYFSLVTRILNLPVTVLGTAVSQVILQRASEEKIRSGKIDGVIRYALLRLGLFSGIYFALMLTAPYLFVLIFGPAWREAGVYAMILAPAVTTVEFVAGALSVLPGLMDREHWAAAWKLIGWVVTACFLWIGTRFAQARVAMGFLCLCNFLLYAAYLALILRSARPGASSGRSVLGLLKAELMWWLRQTDTGCA